MQHDRSLRHSAGRWFTGLILVFTLICGCNAAVEPSNPQPQAATPRNTMSQSPINQAESTRQTEQPAGAKVTLTLGNEATLDQWIQKSRGKVILIDFWATWCGPCVAQFPHTVALAEQHRERGLTVFTVSMDEPDAETQVLEFLQRHHAHFGNLITPYGAGSQFPEAFNIRGDVPCYKLYDRQGRLRYIFSDQPDDLENGEAIAQIDKRIAELLAENAE